MVNQMDEPTEEIKEDDKEVVEEKEAEEQTVVEETQVQEETVVEKPQKPKKKKYTFNNYWAKNTKYGQWRKKQG